ncbi:diguanylate cyclase domain-containing protein [Paenalcaligenes sp. Me52]|uniref:diguanylate cyclase domain-containing protein n=1 Tax=Paenalcaligenes sp. Me52 TaxID=3392038 RepID=UPI003D2ABB17
MSAPLPPPLVAGDPQGRHRLPFGVWAVFIALVQIVLGIMWGQFIDFNPTLNALPGLLIPSGVVLALALARDPRFWVSAAAAQFIYALAGNTSIEYSFLLATIAALEIVLTCWIMRKLRFDAALESPRHFITLLLVLALGTQNLSALGYSVVLHLSHPLLQVSLRDCYLNLWAVSLIEKLLFIPLILAWVKGCTLQRTRLTEFLFSTVLLCLTSYYAYRYGPNGLFLLLPVLAWLSTRQNLLLFSISLLCMTFTMLVTQLYVYSGNEAPELLWFLLGSLPLALTCNISYRTQQIKQAQNLHTSDQYDKLFNQAPVLINSFDMDGRCVVWNKECERVFGWKREELFNSPDPLALLYPDAIQRSAARHSIFTREVSFQTWHPRTKQGHRLSTLWGNIQIDENQAIGIGINLSDHARAEQELLLAKERYENLVQRIPVGVFTLRQSLDGAIMYEYVSPRLCEIYSLSDKAIYADPKVISDCWHEEDRAETIRLTAEARAWLRPMRLDTRAIINGQERWIRIESNSTRLPNGDILCDGVQTDITETRRNEFEQRIAASVFKRSYDSILILDDEHRIINANPSAIRLSGYTLSELRGHTVDLLLPPSSQAVDYQRAIWQEVMTTGAWQGEVTMHSHNQTERPLQVSIVPVRNNKGAILRYIVVGTDVSLLKAREARLERLAHFDSLTQLPNRYLLTDRLRQALSHADRNQNLLATCYVDLDGFKAVNDQYGHSIGDMLLKEVALRLTSKLRKTDTVARLGGDEMVLLLGDFKSPEDSCGLLQELLNLLAQPYQIHGLQPITVSASIGVSFYPSDATDPERLLQLADQAMYLAKQSGKNTYYFHNQATKESPLTDVTL